MNEEKYYSSCIRNIQDDLKNVNFFIESLNINFQQIEEALQFEKERIHNLRSHILSVERDFHDYTDKNPKYSDQWLEARLCKLEEDMKVINEWKKSRSQ